MAPFLLEHVYTKYFILWDRRKEFKELYKNMKPDMGIIIIKSNQGNKCYIEATKDLKSTINSTKFKLDLGSHPNNELQKHWKEFAGVGFSIEILERHEYDKNESKTDYSEELNILELMWEDRLSKKGMEFYEG